MESLPQPRDDEQNAELASFLRELERIPWFANLGEPISGVHDIERISRWDDWSGPEKSGVDEVCYRQQALYDELLGCGKEGAEQLTQLWESIQRTVLAAAAKNVPYDPSEDTWHGPTLAVWHAAWTAGLIGLCLFLCKPIPAEQQEQWQWFSQGHWPCGWTGDFPDGKFIVY